MRKLYFCFCVFLISGSAFSQIDHMWNRPASGAGTEIAYATVVDMNGYVNVTGTFSGTVDFDPGPGSYTLSSIANSNDIYVARYNQTGVLQWAIQIGGPNDERPYDIIMNSLYGMVICGTFQGTVDFNPSATVTNGISLGQYDGFFAAYSTTGTLAMLKTIGSATGNERITGLAQYASSPDILLCGSISGTTDIDPGPAVTNYTVPPGSMNGFYARYAAATGNLTTGRQISGDYSEANGISTDSGNNITVTGCFASVNDFDGSASIFTLASSAPADIDAFFMRCSPTFVFTYAKQIGGPGNDIANAIARDNGQDLYIGGSFSALCDFDPGALTYTVPNAGQTDIFVARYDGPTGNFSWVHEAGGPGFDKCNDVTTDPNGNTYITGVFVGTNIDFDHSAAQATLSSTGTGSSFLASYTSTGSCKFAHGSLTQSEGRGVSVLQTIVPPPYLSYCGNFTATDDFDFTAFTATQTAQGLDDAFLAKYNICTAAPVMPTSVTGQTLICEGSSATYSANYNSAAYGYGWEFPLTYTGTTLTNTVGVTFGSSGTMSVYAYNSCGSSPARTLAITVNPQPTITLLSTHTVICIGETVTLTANGASTYTWSDNSNNTNLVISPTVTSSYTVVGTGTNGCSTGTTITQLVSSCTGLATISSNNIEVSVYPNPFNSVVTISSDIKTGIEIFNVLGSKLYSTIIESGKTEIDLRDQSKGIYFVRIGSVTKKIIKE